jgi:hypothetical protein
MDLHKIKKNTQAAFSVHIGDLNPALDLCNNTPKLPTRSFPEVAPQIRSIVSQISSFKAASLLKILQGT